MWFSKIILSLFSQEDMQILEDRFNAGQTWLLLCSEEELRQELRGDNDQKEKAPISSIKDTQNQQISREIKGNSIIITPEGGKIHTVSVSVDESRPWDQAVRAAGPNTPENHAVRRIGDQYPPQQFKGNREIVLANFGKNMSSEDILTWGKKQRLVPASPRACFAVGEFVPNFHVDLGVDYMAVVSLVLCYFEDYRQVCYVWCDRVESRAYLRRFDAGWNDYYWFAFVRE